jgi:ABC-2 type transport system permease protein
MKLPRETWVVFRRYFAIFLRSPAWVVIGIVQPALYLLLFAPLLKSVATVPGFPSGGAYNVFVPGLLVQLGIFGAAGVGFALIAEGRSGVLERFRVTPVSRFGLLFGRALRDIVVLLIQAIVLIVVALPFGLSIDFRGVLIVLGLVGLIGLAIASLAYTAALRLMSEDSYAALVFTATLPLLLLSGVLLPISFAPLWLQAIAHLNPLSYAVDAARAVFNGHMADASVLRGAATMTCLAVAATVAAARQFGRTVA